VEKKYNKAHPDPSDGRQGNLKIVRDGARVSTIKTREMNAKAKSIESLARIYPHVIRARTVVSSDQLPNQLEIEFPAQPAIKVNHCPKCQSRNRTRIARSWWMRLLPGSRCYQCYSCYQSYLRWYGNSIRR
jgi:hypothetical protein